MHRTIATLITLGILSGCGGDDTSTTPGGGTPTVALTMPATAESGEIVPLSVVVSDDKDQGLTFALTCNGGSLTGSLLTLPAVSAAVDVECTATATDSNGNTGTTKKVIRVTPATASLTAYMGPEQAVPAGGMGILFAQNLPLGQAEYQGSFNGRTIPLYRINGNELAYVLPLDVAAGTGNLTVQVGSRIVSAAISVGSPIAVADSRAQVAGFLQNARQEIVTAMAAPGITAETRGRLETSLPQLNTALSTMPGASDAEISQFASRLAALGLINTGILRLQAYEPIVTGPDCSRNRDIFAKNLAGLVLGAILIAEGTNSAIAGAFIPGVGWAGAVGSGLVIGAGVVIFQKYAPNVNPSRKAFWTSCWTETSINLVPFNPDDFTSVRRVEAITLPGKQGFRPETARNFKLQRVYAPTDAIRAQATQYLSDIAKVLAAASFLPDAVTQALRDFKVTGSEVVPAGRLSLSAVSSSKVSGSASANGDVVTLTFDTSAKAEDLTDGKLPFSFNLLRSGEETVIVNAEMTLLLPEAFDAAVEVTQGETIASTVRTSGAKTLAVTAQPAHGSVSLSDTGQFTYRPSGMYFGKDQFKYIARNPDGDSKEATVLVDVVRKFEGTWQVSVRSTTTSESSPGLCPAESSDFAASVSKISDTQYSTVYSGYELIMSMSSKDDPSGPSGTKSYTEREGDETETGSVSISIPDSQNLRGSGSWTYTGPNGSSCSGSTRITGVR